MTISDVVILIPGFLGFDRIGHFPYFANRVGAGLRGCLAGEVDLDIPVIPIKTCPTESLANRQIALLHTLQEIDYRLGAVERIHLVGHSTGGVDAYLLTGEKPLDVNSSWAVLDWHKTRQKIRTVITVASPHAGTCLALSPLARFFRHPVWAINKSPSLAMIMSRLAFSLHADEMALGAMVGAITDAGGAAAYMLNVLRSRTLVDDLRPQHLVTVHDHFVQDPDLRVLTRSIVTMAGKQTPNYSVGGRPPKTRRPDLFFKGMYDYTAGSGFDDAYDDPGWVKAAVSLVKESLYGPKMIYNPCTKLRTITPMLNDGLVNTARQLINPNSKNSKELLALVVGDHIDVIGYYPRYAPTSDVDNTVRETQLRSGVLHSGSGFGDKQFFEMLRRISHTIVSRIRTQDDVDIGALSRNQFWAANCTE